MGKNARKRQGRTNGPTGPGSRATPTVTRGTSDPRAILWASNSPWAQTGYGQQTAQATQRLNADGHKVAIASNYGLEGAVSTWRDIPHFPRGFDLYSNDVIPAHMASWANANQGAKPLLVTLFDTWIFKGEPWEHVEHIASWVPIDHSPIPPDVAAWCKRPNVTPIAMSEFGQDALLAAGVEALYVPHAIEKVFTPTESITTPTGRLTGREFMGIDPDKFVVTMNAANKGRVPCRKSFAEAFLAFSMFADRHDDAVLYLHTEDRGAMGGIDLHHLAQAVGLQPHQFAFVDAYAYRTNIPQDLLAAVYTASDVLLAPSMGEGFGIPVIEAQACGTPAIVSNFSAQPELVGDGWLVEGQPWWDAAQRSWLITPTVPSIIEALEAAYDRGQCSSDKAIEFASKYDADYVYERYWRPTIKALTLSEVRP